MKSWTRESIVSWSSWKSESRYVTFTLFVYGWHSLHASVVYITHLAIRDKIPCKSNIEIGLWLMCHIYNAQPISSSNHSVKFLIGRALWKHIFKYESWAGEEVRGICCNLVLPLDAELLNLVCSWDLTHRSWRTFVQQSSCLLNIYVVTGIAMNSG